jgi:hypothetical protein
MFDKLYDYAIALSLISSPLNAEIVKIDYENPQLLLFSLAKFTEDAGIFESHDLKYYFTREEKIIEDIYEARKRFYELKNSPPLESTHSFSEYIATENLKIAEGLLDYKKYFYSGHPAFHKEISEEIAEIKDYIETMQSLKNSFYIRYGNYNRRINLKKYKESIGDEAFYNYEIPGLPINLFREKK